MSPQGDLIQLSPSCNGRYVNPKGGSSRPRCQPFLQKLQHWTNRAVNWVNCTSQTPGFKDAPLGRVQLYWRKRVQTDIRPRMGERIYAQSHRETQGEPERALGWLLRSKEVHLRFAKQIPDLEYRLTVQHQFPRPELLSRHTSKYRKYIKARKTALSSRQFICQERNSSVHSLLAGLPSKTAPQPVIDMSVVIIWRRWIAPILTPLRRKWVDSNCATPW